MDLESIMVSKRSQQKRTEPHDFTPLWGIEQKGTNKQTHRQKTVRLLPEREQGGMKKSKRVIHKATEESALWVGSTKCNIQTKFIKLYA